MLVAFFLASCDPEPAGGASREAPMTIEDDLPFKIERWAEGYGQLEEETM
jgi:hypothetical protein